MNIGREILKVAREVVGLRVVIDEAYVTALKREMATEIRKWERLINSPEDAVKYQRAINDMSRNWERVLYDTLLTREMAELSHGAKDIGYYAKNLQSSAWILVIGISDMAHLADYPYRSAKYRDDFGKEKALVFSRVKRSALKAFNDAMELVKSRDAAKREIDFAEKVTVGRFSLVPDGGLEDKTIREAASVMRDAQIMVARSGFKRVLESMVVYVTSKSESGLKAAHYRPSDDSISILPLGVSVSTVVHELGHRNYYRNLTSGDRQYWKEAFDGDLVEVTKDDVEDISKRVQRDWEKEKGGLASNIRDAIAAYVRDRSSDPVSPYKADFFLDHVHYHSDFNFWRETWMTDLVGQRVMKNHITDYANTNEQEAYAEVFQHVVMGKPVPPEVLHWFKVVSS